MAGRIIKVYLDTSVISALFDERNAERKNHTEEFWRELRDYEEEYLSKGIFPERYKDDAIHVAVAVANNIDFLISWNFRHLVKVKTRRMVNLINEILGYPHIEIIAPPEL